MNAAEIRQLAGRPGRLRCSTSTAPKIAKERLHLPGPDFVDRIFAPSDRNNRVLVNLQRLFGHGRLGGTGYLSILPVDQGIEHSAGASFAKNPDYFDPENIVKLAIEGGCNAVASTFGVPRLRRPQVRPQDPVPGQDQPQRAADLSQQGRPDPLRHGQGGVRHGRRGGRRHDLLRLRRSGPADRRDRQAFAQAHELGMATVLWCYLRNNAFKKDKDYHVSADLTGQANHLGVTIQADIIKQKLPENNGGYKALNGESCYGKLDERMYTELTSDHPIDLCRYQVANCYMGRVGADQQRRRLGQERLRRGRQDRRHQQAGRRHGPDLRPQGLPAPDEGGRQAAQRDPGRVPGQGDWGSLRQAGGREGGKAGGESVVRLVLPLSRPPALPPHGVGRIRTFEGLSALAVFKTAAFDHSATTPEPHFPRSRCTGPDKNSPPPFPSPVSAPLPLCPTDNLKVTSH